MTVGVLLDEIERQLAAAGIETPALDAEMLFRHVTGWDRARVIVESQARIDPDVERRIRELSSERARRRPLQHLTGRQAFWRHDFEVSPDVLIPRPETELLVEAALACVSGVARPTLVDVGTGSGCIAVSLAAERSDACVIGIDVSAAALAVARRNAGHLGVATRVDWRQGDLLAPAAEVSGRIDLVASNPPYVDGAQRDALAPEVRDHEPALALFPPGDAYSIYRRLAPQAFAALVPDGWLLLEVGAGMADEVARICAAGGFAVDRIVSDLQSIPRTVVARKRAS
jgi:release factor glutamine methyltransferase